jgi:hypothetical protein
MVRLHPGTRNGQTYGRSHPVKPIRRADSARLRRLLALGGGWDLSTYELEAGTAGIHTPGPAGFRIDFDPPRGKLPAECHTVFPASGYIISDNPVFMTDEAHRSRNAWKQMAW